MSSVLLIRPEVANGINAVFFATGAFGLLQNPFQFLRGTKWPPQKPWFRNSSENPKHPLYAVMQFSGILFLTLITIPVLLAPTSQYLTHSMTIFYFFSILHSLFFFIGYKNVRPTDKAAIAQWIVLIIVNVAFFVVNLLSSLYDNGAIPLVVAYEAEDHILPLFPVNIAVLALVSLFSLFFIIAPIHNISTWFGPPSDVVSESKLCGFDLLPDDGALAFWSRQIGFLMLSFCLGSTVYPVDGVENALYHPLFSILNLITFSTLTLNNMTALQLQTWDGPTTKHYVGTWAPNILLGIAVCILLLLTLI